MAKFYFEKYVNNYEIDFYNYSTEEEREIFKKYDIKLGCYYKSGYGWSSRMSGMTFDISRTKYYPELKKYLDYRFNLYMRKLKIEKIDFEKIIKTNAI